MVSINALQLDLLKLVLTDWADFRTEYNIIAANLSTVGYFVAPANDQVYLLTVVQHVDVTLHFYQTSNACYNEQTVT